MIRRVWRGRTTEENAEAYQALLLEDVLPGIAARDVPGYRGATLLRRDGDEGAEFVTILDFDSLEAVRAFAGEDHEAAYVPDRARELLSKFEERSAHYAHVADVRKAGGAAGGSPTMPGASPTALAEAIRTIATGDAWHGPSLRAAVEGLDAEAAAAHPIPGAHSIWELLLHVGAWAEIVGERVRGERDEVTPERNFPPVGPVSDDRWTLAVRTALERLDALARLLESLDPEDLRRREDWPAATIQVRGVAEHTAYHAGQIVLLRRALGVSVPPS